MLWRGLLLHNALGLSAATPAIHPFPIMRTHQASQKFGKLRNRRKKLALRGNPGSRVAGQINNLLRILGKQRNYRRCVFLRPVRCRVRIAGKQPLCRASRWLRASLRKRTQRLYRLSDRSCPLFAALQSIRPCGRQFLSHCVLRRFSAPAESLVDRPIVLR